MDEQSHHDKTSMAAPQETSQQGLQGATVRFGAGFWIRALARVIDMAVHWATAIVTGMALGVGLTMVETISRLPQGQLTRQIQETSALGYALAGLGYLLYHAVCEGVCGATVGKMVCGLAVVMEDGQRAGLRAALIRSVGFFVDGLFFGAIGASQMSSTTRQQRYGDKWAKTVVVKRGDLTAYEAPSGCLFFLVFLVAIMIDSGTSVVAVVVNLIT